MNLFVDTSVWSLALRRDEPVARPEVEALARALDAGDAIFTTGLILQELLQGFRGPRAHDAIVSRFASLPFVDPERDDHVRAAELRNRCRRAGVQLGTIDALLAALCIRHELTLLTTDDDFRHVSQVEPLDVWGR